MRLLLDTHVFLWAASEPLRLAADVRAAMEDPANDVLVSAVVGWEIAIKYSRGKLDLPMEPVTYVTSRIDRLGFRVLPVALAHGLAVAALPPIHADPFDRLLVAQAQAEGLTLVTSDATVRRYAVTLLN